MKKKYSYQPQYGIVVTCKDEAEQQQVYEKLKKLKLTLKVVVV